MVTSGYSHRQGPLSLEETKGEAASIKERFEKWTMQKVFQESPGFVRTKEPPTT